MEITPGQESTPETQIPNSLRGLALVDREIRRQIGRKGGETIARERGPEYFSMIGRKGGETVARERGSEFYAEIGRKGGCAVSQDRKHMAEIGREGGRSRGRAYKQKPH